MNYREITTTNWFHVDDLKPFRELGKATSYDGKPYLDISDGDVYLDVDEKDSTVQISGDGCLHGIIDPATGSEEGDFDALCAFIQKHLVASDAAIIITAGCERSSELDGSMTVITKNSITSESMFGHATKMARTALGDKTWEPLR